MRHTVLLLWLFAGFLLRPVAGAGGEEVDRLLAAVNGRVITEGDLKLAANLNALLLLGQSTEARSHEGELARLIDLELLRQELENFKIAPADEKGIQQRLDDLIQAYAEIGGLRALLSRLGLQQPELEDYLRLQTSILRFVDLRFRPFTPDPEQKEIDDYYRKTLVPRLMEAGAAVPALNEVSANIAQILKEQKVNTALEQWVSDVKRHSRIEFFRADDVPPEVKP
jgi:hypothetical protein